MALESAPDSNVLGDIRMLQSVTTALEVFEIVAECQPIGVSEITRRIRVTKSTVQRCLMTLHAAGWIRPEGEHSTKWVITAKSFSLGRHVADSGRLRDAVLPVMERLRDTTHESIHLVIAEGREAVLLERVDSTLAIRTFIPLGARAPLHATANGKAILAYWGEQAVNGYLEPGLESLTDRTLRDPGQLREELALIRSRGWSMAVDELADGASAVAAPILDQPGKAVASISISCPTIRFSESVRENYAELILDASAVARRQMLGMH